jgi:hypothetical protein
LYFWDQLEVPLPNTPPEKVNGFLLDSSAASTSRSFYDHIQRAFGALLAFGSLYCLEVILDF